MNWPFLPRLLRPKAIDPQDMRIGGLTLDNRRLFFLPGPHTITYAPFHHQRQWWELSLLSLPNEGLRSLRKVHQARQD